MFLRAAAEYSRLTGGNWAVPQTPGNPPRYIRMRRLMALSKAFDVRPGFGALFTGEFLAHRSSEALAPVKDAIAKDYKLSKALDFRIFDTPEVLAKDSLFGPYQRLANYLLKAYELLNFNGGVYLASGLFAYSVEKTNRTNRILEEAIEPIEHIAGMFIDPECRLFSLKELNSFEWPPENLRDIDSEWQ